MDMAFIDDVRESLSPGSTDDEPTRYSCVDCHTEFEERKQLCPTCGSDVFDHV